MNKRKYGAVKDPNDALFQSAMSRARDFLLRFKPDLSEEVISEVVSRVKLVNFRRNQTIIEYHQVCRHLYLILEGVAKSSKLQDDGERPIWFLVAEDIMISVSSFYTQKEGTEKIVALKPMVCLQLSWEDLNDIYQRHVEFNEVGRLLTERHYARARERDDWRHLSPTELYLILRDSYSYIVQQVSVSELARFIGISRESLSRIRSRIARGAGFLLAFSGCIE